MTHYVITRKAGLNWFSRWIGSHGKYQSRTATHLSPQVQLRLWEWESGRSSIANKSSGWCLTLCAALVSLLRRGLVWALRDGAYSHPYHGGHTRFSSAPLGLWLGGIPAIPPKRGGWHQDTPELQPALPLAHTQTVEGHEAIGVDNYIRNHLVLLGPFCIIIFKTARD